MTETIYAATATAWGGRLGRVSSSDGRLDLQLSMPRAIGGDDGPGTNPEQLFAGGYAACFHGAIKAHAREQVVDVSECAISVTVGVVGGMDSGYDLTVRIEAELPGVDRVQGEGLLAAAYETCPYSRATRNNIVTELVLVESVG